MKTNFQVLFEIELIHEFYEPEKNIRFAKDLAIEPTPFCFDLLRDCGFLFRKKPNGFSVLADALKEKSNGYTLKKPIESQLIFSFFLLTKNPYLLNFSELPLMENHGQMIYRVHNLQNNIKEKQLLLTRDIQSEFLGEKDLIFAKSRSFSHQFTTDKIAVEMQVRDETGNTIMSKTIFSNEGFVDYQVDLSGLSPGSYTLFEDNIKELDFYADNQIAGKNIFGVIDIYNSDKVAEAYRFTDDTYRILPKKYTLKIASRKVFWKYMVVLKNHKKAASQDLTINLTGNHGGLNFIRQADVVLPDGLRAVPFISDRAVAFSSKPLKGIQLIKQNNHSSGIFEIQNLPNAPVYAIKPDSTSDKIYSEIFIYV